MFTKDIAQFQEIKSSAISYFCFSLSKNIPKKLVDDNKDQNLKALQGGILKTFGEFHSIDSMSIFNTHGLQIGDILTHNPHIKDNPDGIATEDYFVDVLKKESCVMSSPRPASHTKDMIISFAYPIFDENYKIKYIVVMNIRLTKLLSIIHPSSMNSIFGYFSRITYGIVAFALTAVALLLFLKGVVFFASQGIQFWDIKIEEIFKSTILLTLALAIFDLVKTIFEEEVIGSRSKNDTHEVHKTMVKFLGSIIIALAIEALMLVFKFAITGPENIIYAIYILAGVSILLIGLAMYVKIIGQGENKN